MFSYRPAKVGGCRNAVKAHVHADLAAERNKAEWVHTTSNRLGRLTMFGVDSAEIVFLQKNTRTVGAVCQSEVTTVRREKLLGRYPQILRSPTLLFDPITVFFSNDDGKASTAAFAAACAVITLKAGSCY